MPPRVEGFISANQTAAKRAADDARDRVADAGKLAKQMVNHPIHPPPHRAASLALSQVALFKCCLVHGSWRASRRWQTASARSGRARTRKKSASLHDILPQRDSRRGASQ